MTRPLRIEFAGAYHHVTARGVARMRIFFDDADRAAFLKRLAELPYRWGLRIHAYCLMANHYHLEVETPEPNLSRGLQWLNHRYASFINWRHQRVGHLFQGRFKSALVEADTHLHLLSRYIHMNPVRAGLCKAPADYDWSSYRAYVGYVRSPVWLETEETLRRFGGSRAEQLRRYRKFVEGERAEDPLKELAFGAVVGSTRFVDWVRDKLSSRKPDSDVSGLELARPRPAVGTVCEIVSRDYGVSEARARLRWKKENAARDAAIYLSRELTGLRNAEIGSYYGGVGASAVSLACARVEIRAAKDARLRRQLLDLTRQILPAGDTIKD